MPRRALVALALVVAAADNARADLVTVTITNTQPQNGAFLTPVVVGAHNGSFTLFTPGSPASAALEALAEDGTTGPLVAAIQSVGGVAGVGGMGPIAPGQSVSVTLDVNPITSGFLTFASMIIPSNDAFIGNPSPIPLFDADGRLLSRTLTILGSQVWDAGTEVNDEVPANTAFLAQTAPNTGVTENGVVALHGGFLGSFALGGPVGNILGDPRFANADFTLPGATIAQVQIQGEGVPEPLTAAVLGLGVVAVAGRASLRRRARVA